MKQRISWLDGMKGVACVGVVLHHFLLAFFPAAYYGNADISHMKSGLDVKLAQAPWAVGANGNYMVAIFCLISALILSLQVMGLENKDEVSLVLLKRYPRLMLPIVPMVLIVYVMLKYGCFHNGELYSVTMSQWLASYYMEPVSFQTCLESIFVTTWFDADSTFSNAFWMLGQLFMGSFLSVILSTFAWKTNKNVIWAYIFCALMYVRINDLGLAFVLGTLLAYCYRERKELFGNVWIGAICLVLGLFLGGFPSGVIATNIYKYMYFLPSWCKAYQFWHIIGALLTVYGCWNLGMIQRILSSKVCLFLGKISYSIYIVHIPILFFASVNMFGYLMEAGISYGKSAGLTFAFTWCIIILLAYMYYRVVEGGCGKFLGMLMKKLTT